MTIGLVAQHPVTAFVNPINGQTPISATIVLSNDNTTASAYTTHDADGTIHLQSSTLAARPAAGTAGRKWMTSDGYRIYYDDGAAWHEAAYPVVTSGTVTVSTPILDLSQTWNAGGSSFTGVVLNITDTASAANSFFVQYQIAGVQKYSVRKDGFISTVGGAEISGNALIDGNLTLAILGSGGGLVTTGAADSGGAGFRLMRVPN